MSYTTAPAHTLTYLKGRESHPRCVGHQHLSLSPGVSISRKLEWREELRLKCKSCNTECECLGGSLTTAVAPCPPERFCTLSSSSPILGVSSPASSLVQCSRECEHTGHKCRILREPPLAKLSHSRNPCTWQLKSGFFKLSSSNQIEAAQYKQFHHKVQSSQLSGRRQEGTTRAQSFHVVK